MRLLFVFIVFILHFSTIDLMAQYLITKQEAWHCKKGWYDCEGCKSVYDYQYALLLLSPTYDREAARPMIKTSSGWATYDVKQWFKSLEEAQAYSKAHNVPIEIAAEDQYPLLRKLSAKLPPKWFLRLDAEKSELEIYSPQIVYTTFENKINAPAFINQGNKEKEGKKGYPFIQYTLKKPLTASEKQNIERKNAEISQKIEGLPKKYAIQHLQPEYVHGKNVYPNYPNATEEEKKRIQAYQQELEMLEKQYLPTPMYSTAEFDLWNETFNGIETATESVFPESISKETYEVLKLVRDFFSHSK